MAIASGQAVVGFKFLSGPTTSSQTKCAHVSQVDGFPSFIVQNSLSKSVVLGFSAILVYSMHSHSILERKPTLPKASAHI